jgi:hypothetical protein
MTNETEPATPNPAAALERDLADIRALLRQAVAISSNVNKGAETRLAAMTAATRLFSATAKGSEMIARLRGHVHETRHTTVVENGDMPGPRRPEGQDYDEWWNSLSARERAAVEARVNAVAEKYIPLVLAEREEERAEREREMRERGDPSKKNPKTTSTGPEPDDPEFPEREET